MTYLELAELDEDIKYNKTELIGEFCPRILGAECPDYDINQFQFSDDTRGKERGCRGKTCEECWNSDIKRDNEKVNIRNIVKKSGMSKKEFAKYVGIPLSKLNKWERNEEQLPEFVLQLLDLIAQLATEKKN